MKKDIQNRQDIILLVNSFYDKVKADELIGVIFTEIMKVKWETHLPVMYDFWENALFFTGTYNGNPMQVHQQIHARCPLNTAHFERWNQLFLHTTDELFTGEKASLAKQRATSISTVMQIKVLGT
jgi:hemoglobin